MDLSFKLFDFNTEQIIDDNSNDNKKDNKLFRIQMFGLNECGETCCIYVNGFNPYFYIKSSNKINESDKNGIIEFLKEMVDEYYNESFIDCECELVNHNKLYGFDANKKFQFIKLSFKNYTTYNKVKNLWYKITGTGENYNKVLDKRGVKFKNNKFELYEAHIPPLLRYFHITNISPSGWISINNKYLIKKSKNSYCKYEFNVHYKNIIPEPDKEMLVPYKICSFDIEASSSHGDFPLPKKDYKKLCQNIIENLPILNIDKNDIAVIIENMIYKAFEVDFDMNIFSKYEINIDNIELVYPKNKSITKNILSKNFEKLLKRTLKDVKTTTENLITNYYVNYMDDEEEDREISNNRNSKNINLNTNIQNFILNKEYTNDLKIEKLNILMKDIYPELEGDKVTFIGSTFLKYGNEEPYLNHIIVLNSCSDMENVNNAQIDEYNSEREVLLAWNKLIKKEDPDIIIGYNIFGFDYNFMYIRSQENNCEEEFLKLSRIKNEICGTRDQKTNTIKIEESNITIASGTHDLKYIKMNGRLQVDLYNYFRRDFNLTSYKLDYVSGYFIGDDVLKKSYDEENETTKIFTKNITGLNNGTFINFEEISHSSNYYKNGKKFEIFDLNKDEKTFCINSIEEFSPNVKVKWGLAKDDVTPQDIFRLTNEGPNERAIIAKYCIQDCNLIHYLLNKIDVLTGYFEMANLCSVPISFLVFRGQGIKLTSYIAKKCREKDTLMPTIDKGSLDVGYEGAIVLEPKCNLYLSNPVACVDYSSLYPSSMISENLSHDSKVWTKTYDLNDNLIEETGEKDIQGNFIYDNLPDYKYVDVTYDTYKYTRKTPSASAVKVISGCKTCRYAQFPDNKKAIMPSILEELLAARKATKKLIKTENDPFMKNILDKRQLSIKLTANSLYGQTGAKTSTFYELDVAASTTATGRKLLIYAKELIEKVYKNRIVEIDGIKVKTQAEYIYGDSVANYTPIYIKKNNKLEIITIEDLGEKYGNDLWKQCKDEGKQTKEYIDLTNEDLYSYTEKGWTKLNTIIRHKLASHKKMVKILTHNGCVDVTDDHSLLTKNGEEISPNKCNIGDELLHSIMPNDFNNDNIISENEAKIYGFFFGDGSCGIYDCPSGKKNTWALNNKCLNMINKYLNLCKIVYPEFTWKYYDTLKSSNVYKLSFCINENNKRTEFIKKYVEKCYYKRAKIIPEFILNGTLTIKEAFLEGYYDADGSKKGSKRLDTKHQISASHLYYLIQTLGYNTSINTRSDKPNIYRINYSYNKHRKNINAIKKINIINNYNNYVYDLTTENHHFAAGIGNMIVHNTDSVFFTFNFHDLDDNKIEGEKALDYTIKLAQEAGELATRQLKKPHDLEYEKTFMPFCLLSKKRYVGMLYELDPNKCKRKSMGIVLKRRDNAPIVKDIYGGIIDILMKEQNIETAIKFLRGSLQEIVDGKISIDKLIITKSIRSYYKNPKQIAHKVLANRMAQRDPGNKPAPGDRIPYVYINTNNKKALQGDKIEHPSYILENKLKINYSFYITNQIMKPVIQVFSLVLENMKEFKRAKKGFLNKLKTMKQNMDNETYKKKEAQLKDKEVEKLLFSDYLIDINNIKNNNQLITNFFTLK